MTPTTNLRIITIVVLSIAANSFIGISTLSYCMVIGLKPDPTLITAYVGITSGLVGALTGLLVNTRTSSAAPAVTPVTVENREPVDVAIKRTEPDSN